MTPENIKTLLRQTPKLMYGLNYEVTLGIEIFDSCFSLSDVNNAIKRTFSNSNLEEIEPVAVSVEDFWKDINDKFDYRGNDNGSYLKLNEQQERELKRKQNEIKHFVAQYIVNSTKVYSYPFLEGIPGYPVFWEFAFALLNVDGNCVFFFGSSSD
jgi:hypothetical protein